MNNLVQRILTAVVGVPILLFIFYKGGLLFLAFILAVIVMGQLELFKLLKTVIGFTEKAVALASSVILAVAAYYGHTHVFAFFTVLLIIVFCMQLRKQDLSNAVIELSITLLGIIYLGLFLSHAILLRNTGNIESLNQSADIGFFFVIFAVACTFLNDTGAYFAGKYKGKKKLIPRISPGKTYEGTIAGIATATLTGGIVNLCFKSPLPYTWAFLFGFVIGVVAVFGDLIESLIKRSVGVKDSGSLLPGHGGVLDRFDSLIIVFPVSYYLVLFYYWTKGIYLF